MDNLASNYADTMSKSIEEVMAAVAAAGEVEGQEATEYLDEWPLEIVNRRGAAFQVVLTLGGPDARVVCDLDSEGERYGDARLEVRWGGDSATRYGQHIDALADYFAELVRY